MKGWAIFLLALVIGFTVGYGSREGAIQELELEARAMDDTTRILVELRDSVTAELVRVEREHQDSIQELEAARTELRETRRPLRISTDTLLRLIPDSLGIREAVLAERQSYELELSAQDAIIHELEGINAALRERLERDQELIAAALERGDRWKAVAEAREGEARKWKIVTGVVAVVSFVLTVVR